MATRAKKRRLDDQQGSGRQSDLVEGGLPRADGRWVCPFCNAVLNHKNYLVRHVNRDHEVPECRGEAMTIYLQEMSRWLCGVCDTTTSLRFKTCNGCGGSQENMVPGHAPAGPNFIWPRTEEEQIADAAMGEEAMVTETQDLLNLPSLDEVFAICGPLLKYVPKICRDLWTETIF